MSKQFLRIGAKPILFYTLHQFDLCPAVDEIILVVKAEDLAFAAQEIVDRYGIQKVKRIVAGGAERQDSVYAGLQAIANESEIVVIHDGVRPFISVALLELGIQQCREFGAVVTAVPVTSTIKRAEKGIVQTTLDRSELWEIQTPQIFRYDLIRSAYEESRKDGFVATDDAMMVERLGMSVQILPGERRNIKITTREDMAYAAFLLEKEKCSE